MLNDVLLFFLDSSLPQFLLQLQDVTMDVNGTYHVAFPQIYGATLEPLSDMQCMQKTLCSYQRCLVRHVDSQETQSQRIDTFHYLPFEAITARAAVESYRNCFREAIQTLAGSCQVILRRL